MHISLPDLQVLISYIRDLGMGIVYKAEDTKLKRTVALKFLSAIALGGSVKIPMKKRMFEMNGDLRLAIRDFRCWQILRKSKIANLQS